MVRCLGACAVGATVLGFACIASSATAQTIRDDLYVTNGVVNAIARYGNTLYFGGDFTRVAPSTGSGVPIDKVTALAEPGFPKVAGIVYASASDGNGGWYLGGDFRAVGGIPRINLAHVLGDHTVAPWNPSPDWIVTELAFGDGAVFVGGSFQHVGGASRRHLAALDATTGEATGWNPNPDGWSIHALMLSGSTLYVTGDFTTIGSQARAGLAALSTTTGIPTSWDPNPDGPVFALASIGSTIYVCGDFSAIGGAARDALAALDATTGDATPWQWHPESFFTARVLAASGSTVYVGGEFTYSSGGNVFADLGAFDATSGLPVATWNSGGGATELAIDGATLYVAGFVQPLSGPARSGLVAVDAATGVPSSWDPQPNGEVLTLALDDAHLFAGGRFASLGGAVRLGLAALDLTNGEPTSWSPVLSGSVRSLGISGPNLYAAGEFELGLPDARFAFQAPIPIDTAQVRRNLASFDLTTGEVTAWDPNASTSTSGLLQQRISVMTVSGSTVYVGGRFNEIAGQTRNYLAAIDGQTGAVKDWNPSPRDSISAITVHGDVVYVGGCFDSIGALPRRGVAALSASAHDSTDGITLAWDPKLRGDQVANPWPNPPWMPRLSRAPVRAIAVRENVVYLGGRFDYFGDWPAGQYRWSLAAVDAATATLLPWDAGMIMPPPGGVTAYISALAADSAAVYASGEFMAYEAPARVNLMALNPITGARLGWYPVPGGGLVSTLLAENGTIYLGGGFISVGDQAQATIAAVEAVTGPVSVEGPSMSGVATPLSIRPNPATGSVSVAFSLPEGGPARLELLDLAGRRVASRDVGPLGAGRHVATLAPDRPLPAGLYWARLNCAGRSLAARVVVLR